MASEFGEVLPNQWYFGQPSVDINAEQLRDICRRKIEAGRIEVGGLRQTSNRSIEGMNFAFAALENPFQYAAVLAVAGPQKLAVFVCPEPVNVVDFGQLRSRSRAN